MSDAAPWSLDTRRPLVGTAVLIGLVVAVHVGSGLMWSALHGIGVADTLVFDRSAVMRMRVGGQHQTPLADGELWRLVTSVFLHGDLLHLLINATSVYALGRLLEPTLGTLRWVGWFLIGGVGASLACWQVGVLRSDGASGGAFALLAAAVVLGTVHRDRWAPEDRRLMGPVLGLFLVGNLVVSWLIPGIDAIAHMVGAAVGVALALVDPVRPRVHVVYIPVIVLSIGVAVYGGMAVLGL